MAYASWSVVANEQPSTAKWNILGTNMASFNDGTGISSGVLTRAQLVGGLVKNRQGGTTGDASWSSTSGTSNTDTSAKATVIQVGIINTSATATVTVTFPTAFTQSPIVMATGFLSGGTFIVQVEAVTTTTFNIGGFTTGGARTLQSVMWFAVGQ